jgi:hypothetical protein
MILVRTVFKAKFGRAGELAAAIVKQLPDFPEVNPRVLTDLSGPMDTVIVEFEAESLDEVFRRRLEMYANPQLAQRSALLATLVESGRNEYYTIES